MLRKKVYVETTVISDATALPTNDLSMAGRQITTRKWWMTATTRFDLFCSDVVKREAGLGDNDAAKRRISALDGMAELQTSVASLALAKSLIDGKAVPKEYPDDALHIALAAVSGMDFLVSWNFRHITNANQSL